MLAGWLAGWLAGRLVCWLVGWLAGWAAGWLPGWLAASWVASWVAGCPACWLLAGWLGGWFGEWLAPSWSPGDSNFVPGLLFQRHKKLSNDAKSCFTKSKVSLVLYSQTKIVLLCFVVLWLDMSDTSPETCKGGSRRCLRGRAPQCLVQTGNVSLAAAQTVSSGGESDT